MAAAVVSRGVALCSRLVPSECDGGHQGKQQQQLRNLRYCCSTSLRTGNPSSSSSSSRRRGATSFSQWSSSSSEVDASGRGNIGVAGVEAETSDEVTESRRGMTIGQATVQGLREEMEDDAIVQDGPLGFTYAAVFDGHGGFAAVQFLRDELYKECVQYLEEGKLLESDDQTALQEALVHAFHQTDSRLLSWLASDSDEKEAGSTATILFMRNDSVTVAHVGDSRTVLSRSGKAVDLSGDHRPFGNSRTSIAEINRVKKAGGWVNHGRLCSMLSVSRAFGDVNLKTKKKEMIEEGITRRQWTRAFTERFNLDGIWLSVTPDVNRVQLDEDAEFIIVASDGLWDSFKSKEAVKFVRKQLQKHGDVQQAADAIAQATLERHGQDNISVIIVDLGKVPQGESGISLKWW